MKELWLLRDRQMVLERLIEQAGIGDRRMIDRYEPSPEAEAEIRLEVDRMIGRVFDRAFQKGPPNIDDLKERVRQEIEIGAAVRSLDGQR